VRIELEPAQPDEVVRAVASLLRAQIRPVDPWWQAGLEEALEDHLPAQGEATARPRRMLGAERA
jgi:hypothetical protein